MFTLSKFLGLPFLMARCLDSIKEKHSRDHLALHRVGLAIFTLLGPYLWRVDPALQDLNQISQPPSWPKTAILVGAYERFQPIELEDFPAEPEEYLDEIPAPTNIRTFEEPTTQQVRIIWDPVEGAGGYNIYRNQRLPEGINDLGLPLGSTMAGNAVSYEDRLNLEARRYYSIVSTDGFDESFTYSTFEVTLVLPSFRGSHDSRAYRSRADESR